VKAGSSPVRSTMRRTSRELYDRLYFEIYTQYMPTKIENLWKALAASAMDRDLDSARRAFFALRHELVVKPKKLQGSDDDIEFEPIDPGEGAIDEDEDVIS